ncbi:IclR family transcriptional regulator [Actinoplanes sp. ATCC 53533]|uniref:IclR family transcriptional regulator n=1 Tax=Actinoplanes sp. ATCC 53533 TaxID=1288362 RepID=UPI001F30A251|nr:IclR family transcriptional regulator [Actinoplanes sp. ATCC 53533]
MPPEIAPPLVGADRVLAVLAELARHADGASLEEMTRAVASPKPTVHRALASLCRFGFAARDGHGRYVLGDEFLRLAFAHHEARPDHLRITPVLSTLAERYGETAHYAVLDGHTVVYRAKVDPPAGALRLSSTIGGRNPAHSTAVGKLLLSYALSDDAAVTAWVGERPLTPRTPRTLTSADAFAAELAAIRGRGYAVDDQENDPGIVCLAVPVFLTSPTRPSGAVSVSAPVSRTPLATLVAEVDAIRATVQAR